MLAILPFDPFGAPNGNFVNAQTGKFQMKRVMPGRYMLYAAPINGRGGDDPNAIWGGMEVEVRDQDIDNLNIVAKHGAVLSGKVIVEDQPDAAGVAPASGLYIAIRPQPLIGTRALSHNCKGISRWFVLSSEHHRRNIPRIRASTVESRRSRFAEWCSRLPVCKSGPFISSIGIAKRLCEIHSG